MTDVLRRRVYFISGFDPRGVNFYRRLYREEAQKQSRLNGSALEIGPRRKLGPSAYAWDVDARWPEGEIRVDYQFLAWDKIIRARWQSNWALCLATYLRDFAQYVLSGAFAKVMRTGKGPTYTALVPLAVCMAPLLLALLVWLSLGWLAGLGAAALSLWGIYALSRRLKLVWLLNIYGFCGAWGKAPLPDLDARLDEMAAHIVATERADPAEDAVLVGHSVGALLAVPVMAKLLEAGTPVRLLTLGGCIPVVGFMPPAAHFRAFLQALAKSPALSWLDVASLSDPLSFARVDPLAVCGIERVHPKTQTRQLAKFVHMFKPDVYAGMKRDKLRVHFQYLMAADLPTDYDYFRLTAGPKQKRGAP